MQRNKYICLIFTILLCFAFKWVLFGCFIILHVIQLTNFFNDASFPQTSTIIVQIFTFSVITLIGFIINRKDFKDIFKFRSNSARFWILFIIFAVGVVISVSWLGDFLREYIHIPRSNNYKSLVNNDFIVRSIMVTILIPAVTEELFYRGLIFNILTNNCAEKIAIVLSSLLFSLSHIVLQDINVLQIILTFVLGLVMVQIYVCSKTLLTSMIIHALYNFYQKTPELFDKSIATIKDFPPLWLNVIGIIFLVIGIFCLIKFSKRNKDPFSVFH